MKLRQMDDVLVVEPDEPEPELIVIDLEDGDVAESPRMVLTPEEARREKG